MNTTLRNLSAAYAHLARAENSDTRYPRLYSPALGLKRGIGPIILEIRDALAADFRLPKNSVYLTGPALEEGIPLSAQQQDLEVCLAALSEARSFLMVDATLPRRWAFRLEEPVELVRAALRRFDAERAKLGAPEPDDDPFAAFDDDE